MRKQSIKSVKEIFEVFPSNLLDKLGEDTEIDKNVSRLYGELMFKLLIFASVRSDKLSTRILEEIYNGAAFKVFSGKGNHKTRHSSIADRLTTMNYEYFEQIFEWSVEQFSKMIPKGSRLFQKIKRFDSTMISISSALVDWGMRVGRLPRSGHSQVHLKFTMGMHASLPSSIRAFFDQGHLSEETALEEAIMKSKIEDGDIIVFDRGLKNRSVFKAFDNQGIKFVTRGSENIRYEKKGTYRQIKGRKADGLKFIDDMRVVLYQNGHNILEHEFRVIEAEVVEKGKRILFITNIWDLSAMEIARIYKYRWDIEVFFRFMKQQLNIKHLLNRSENGVKIQIYTALITAIMLLVYKKVNQISSYVITKIRFEDRLLFLMIEQAQMIAVKNNNSNFT